MNGRMRYLIATVCAVMAGLLTLLYLGGNSSAEGGETEVIWVTRQPVAPGTRLTEEMLQRVRVDGPTRKLLAKEALASNPADSPGQWYAVKALETGQPLIPGQNIAAQPAPRLPAGSKPSDLRVVTLAVDSLPTGTLQPGEDVDIYVIPAKGGEAIRILAETRVLLQEDGLIAVLVPEPQVGPVLAATNGAPAKVVRRLQETAP
jgi:hypothetical protein